MNYECVFCGYNTPKIYNMKKHINKKKSCDPKVTEKFYQYDILKMCIYCNNKYENKKNHEKECKFIKNSEIEKLNIKIMEIFEMNNKLIQKLEEQKDEQKELKEQVVNNNININYNISVNNFDMFTTTHINRNMIFDFFKDRAVSRDIQDLNPVMFEMIYCYENSRENHSIYVVGDNIFVCKDKRFVRMHIDEINKFLDDIFKGRIKYKICEIFDKGYLSSDNITESEFNDFKDIYDNYTINNRTLKLKFEHFKPIIEQNIDIINDTLKILNPKYITKELKQLID